MSIHRLRDGNFAVIGVVLDESKFKPELKNVEIGIWEEVVLVPEAVMDAFLRGLKPDGSGKP